MLMVTKGPIDNSSISIDPGDCLLQSAQFPEPLMAQFTSVYMISVIVLNEIFMDDHRWNWWM